MEYLKEILAGLFVLAGGIVGSFLTYLGTKQSSKSSVDSVYLENIEKLLTRNEFDMKDLKVENGALKSQFDHLTREVDRLRNEMHAKDKLIERLEEDNRKLENDKQTYKRLLQEANEQINILKGVN